MRCYNTGTGAAVTVVGIAFFVVISCSTIPNVNAATEGFGGFFVDRFVEQFNGAVNFVGNKFECNNNNSINDGGNSDNENSVQSTDEALVVPPSESTTSSSSVSGLCTLVTMMKGKLSVLMENKGNAEKTDGAISGLFDALEKRFVEEKTKARNTLMELAPEQVAQIEERVARLAVSMADVQKRAEKFYEHLQQMVDKKKEFLEKAKEQVEKNEEAEKEVEKEQIDGQKLRAKRSDGNVVNKRAGIDFRTNLLLFAYESSLIVEHTKDFGRFQQKQNTEGQCNKQYACQRKLPNPLDSAPVARIMPSKQQRRRKRNNSNAKQFEEQIRAKIDYQRLHPVAEFFYGVLMFVVIVILGIVGLSIIGMGIAILVGLMILPFLVIAYLYYIGAIGIAGVVICCAIAGVLFYRG